MVFSIKLTSVIKLKKQTGGSSSFLMVILIVKLTFLMRALDLCVVKVVTCRNNLNFSKRFYKSQKFTERLCMDFTAFKH